MFVLGVGAQKAGTQWLQQQLRSLPEFVGPPLREERHFWDELFSLKQPRSSEEDFMTSEPDDGINLEATDAYFAEIMPRRRVLREEIRVDITPAYAGLPRGALTLLKQGLDGFKIRYRIVFLIRDPVDRILSAYHMYHRANFSHLLPELLDPAAQTGKVKESNILRFSRSWNARIRTRYDLTLENLHTVFPPEKVFVALTESLRFPAVRLALSRFLATRPRHMSGPPVHLGDYDRILSEEATQEIATQFRPVYRAVARNFPEISELWPSYNLALQNGSSAD